MRNQEVNQNQEKKDWVKITKEALIKFFKSFTLFEILFLSISLIAVITVSIVCKSDGLSIAYSIVAIFTVFAFSKGVFIAPLYQVATSIIYATQSYYNGLYGELIKDACILAPFYIVTMVIWVLNKKKNKEIQITTIGWKEWLCIIACALVLIVPVYFGLQALNTKYLYLSIPAFILPLVSVYLVSRRSVFQFVSFLLQNIVGILLWLMPIFQGEPGGIELLPVAVSFGIFIINNSYGLWNWTRKYKAQKQGLMKNDIK